MRNYIPFLVILSLFSIVFDTVGQGDVRQSKLSDGDWYKIKVRTDSVYKIDFQFLSDIGINPGNIDPQKIQIWGNPYGMLPQLNSDPRPIDLNQTAIYLKGEEDGVFNSEDYLLFYGKGPDLLGFDSESREAYYEKHRYSDFSYYFLTIGSDNGKRVSSVTNPGDNFKIVDHFVSTQAHETDSENRVDSGREWYERLSASGINTYGFVFPGFLSSNPIYITSQVMAFSYDPISFTLDVNGVQIGNHDVNSVPKGSYASKGRVDQKKFSASINPGTKNDSVTLNYSFTATGSESKGYLDYLIVTAKSALALYGNQTIFEYRDTQEPITFEISGLAGNELIWDITDPVNVLSLEYTFNNSNGTFGSLTPWDKSYILINPEKVDQEPVFIEKIQNQNVQGLGPANLLIISHPGFISEANRLADLRRSHDQLSVHVVTPEQIFNEFSSGMSDVTAIRDYIKYLYDIDHSTSGIRYVLMFGKGTYDYKGNVEDALNFVPIYESRNSLHPIYSYSSDDYFGLMEDNEGEWIESSAGDETMELGIGRLPVKTLQEARSVVDKYYSYELSPKSFGDWRNTITFVADDGDNNLHLRQANRLSDTVVMKRPLINHKKIYIDAYEQESLPAAQRATKVNERITESIRQGTLIMNYTGHGNERQWASERVLDWPMIDSWSNEYQLPLFITATCEFGRHDNPGIVSGGERIILKPKGGAIAIVTTARPVFASQNFELNNAFYQSILASNSNVRLGDVLKETKNNSLAGSVNRNFSLLGDPSLLLAFPSGQIIIESINNSSTYEGDTLSALSNVNIQGSINFSGSLNKDFNGILSLQLFEKPTEKRTLGDENPSYLFEERDNILFKGRANVINGKFNIEFIVPKNISYKYGTGKISMYAYSSNLNTDASGSSDIIIGGSDQNTMSDQEAPNITLFIGDTTFREGMVVKPNTILVGRFYDESGITISNSNLNQNIQAILDDSIVFDLNEYYSSEIDTYKSGWIYFPLNNLQPGAHSIKVKAWDVYNNPGEGAVSFIVSEKDQLVMENLKNYPNPFSAHNAYTTFRFDHNRSGEDLDIHLQIYNGNGAIVKESRYEMYQSFTTADGIEWDGRNSTGKKVRPGIYYYRIIARSTMDGASSQLYQKLIIY